LRAFHFFYIFSRFLVNNGQCRITACGLV